MKKRQMMLILSGILPAVMVSGYGSVSALAESRNIVEDGQEKTKITIMVDHDFRVDDIGEYLMEKYPDVEFDILLGRNGVSYLKKAAEHDDLPDICISGSTWGRDGSVLNEYLYDLSTTDIASNFYSVYLDNFTTADGSVYWLPGCAAIEGVMANKTLFDENHMELPTDYASFVEACEKFTELGIRPYASDYKYDYTCGYLLQAWSIPLLQSADGKDWRLSFEEGEVNTLDETIGLNMFDKLAEVFELTGVTEEDATRGYGATASDLAEGKLAMIRQSTNNSAYYDMGLTELVILPYFGETEEDGWYFTTPSYAVAMSGKLKGSEKEEVCLDIIRNLFSQECMNIFAEEVQAFTAYNKGISFEVKEEFENILPYLEINHMYTYLAQENFQAASKNAVQKMIAEHATSEEALAAFNESVVQTKEEQPVLTTFEHTYSRIWTESGNAALSAVVNTLAKIEGCDIMLAPATLSTGSIYADDYTAEEISNLLYGGGVNFYRKEITGAEIKKIVTQTVKGWGSSYDPISLSTLPAVSGCQMIVSETEGGNYQLDELMIDGEPIDEAALFQFVYTDNTPSVLRNVYEWEKEAHDGFDVAADENNEEVDKESYEGFLYPSEHVGDIWLTYFSDGGSMAEPTDYISVQ